MRRAAWITAGLLEMLASGCARHRAERGGETVTFGYADKASCAGRCDSYEITLGPDGQGILGLHDGVNRRFQASPDQVTAFDSAIAPYRPRRGERLLRPDHAGCGQAQGDGAVISVVWQPADQPPDSLDVFAGCGSAKARRTFAALAAAPARLPIAGMIPKD